MRWLKTIQQRAKLIGLVNRQTLKQGGENCIRRIDCAKINGFLLYENGKKIKTKPAILGQINAKALPLFSRKGLFIDRKTFFALSRHNGMKLFWFRLS